MSGEMTVVVDGERVPVRSHNPRSRYAVLVGVASAPCGTLEERVADLEAQLHDAFSDIYLQREQLMVLTRKAERLAAVWTMVGQVSDHIRAQATANAEEPSPARIFAVLDAAAEIAAGIVTED